MAPTIGSAAPALPGESCQKEPHSTWSAVEQEVWTKYFCVGELANLSGRQDSDRLISSRFIEMVLLHDPWRSAMPKGVYLQGALFEDLIDLNFTRIDRVLFLEDSEFMKTVSLIATTVDGDLSFERSKFREELRLDRIVVSKSLYLGGGEFAALDLTLAKVDGHVEMREAEIAGTLKLELTAIGAYLSMDEAHFGGVFALGARIGEHVDLTKATIADALNLATIKIGGNADLNGATVSGALNMASATVGANLVINSAQLSSVDLRSTKIGGSVDMDSAKIVGGLNMQAATIGASLFARGAELTGPADLGYLTTGELWLSGSKLVSVDLTGATIRGQFALSQPKVSWSGDQKLILRNATAGFIQGSPDAWPNVLDLRGFQYQALGGAGADDMTNYFAIEYLNWLERSKPFSPQPYEHLAQLLAKSGYGEQSREVLFAAREGERKQASWPTSSLKFLSLILIGHTHRLHYIFIWIGLLVVAGAIVIHQSGEAQRLSLGTGIAFSFDRLIPLIKLEEGHYKVTLKPWVRNYFYVHQIMGYVLGSFVVAWVSGILK